MKLVKDGAEIKVAYHHIVDVSDISLNPSA